MFRVHRGVVRLQHPRGAEAEDAVDVDPRRAEPRQAVRIVAEPALQTGELLLRRQVGAGVEAVDGAYGRLALSRARSEASGWPWRRKPPASPALVIPFSAGSSRATGSPRQTASAPGTAARSARPREEPGKESEEGGREAVRGGARGRGAREKPEMVLTDI
ncbi:hypothetical protein GCM10010363_27550 [Streptomyces omiyaensis]|nr:hypothetical protein GCM10010363_27550 [Streptomyces omiyaensis]